MKENLYYSNIKHSSSKICNGLHSANNIFFQPKLTINNPNDIYEQEADTVAEKVIQSKSIDQSETFFKPLTISSIQRKCESCEHEEEELQRKEENTNEVTANEGLENYVGGLGGSGNNLPNNTKSFFESRIGYDFSNVKIHTDSVAAKSAQSINALAYTSGNNIVFNQNQYQPETDTGKKLLAHELTHVVQQNDNISTQIIQKTSTAPEVVWGFEVWRNMCGCIPEINNNISEANDFGAVYSSCDIPANTSGSLVETCFDRARPGTTVGASTAPGGAISGPAPATTPCEKITNHSTLVHEHFHARQADRFARTVGGSFYSDWVSLARAEVQRLATLTSRYPAEAARFMTMWNDGHEWASGETESYLWERRFLVDVSSALNRICTP